MEIIASQPTTRSKRDPKLQIPVRGTNRKFFLVPPNPKQQRPDYYLRFQVPREMRERDPKLPKVVFRSTATNMLAAARIRARNTIESIMEGRWEDAEKTKICIECASLGEIIARYKPSPRVVAPRTAMRNVSSLELMVREGLGRENVRDERADRWATEKFLRKWMQMRLERVQDLNFVEQERAAVTINSTLAQARSVLSPKVMELYEDLKLPDLTAWRAVRKLKVEANVAYRPLPEVCVDAIARDAQLLRDGKSALAATAGLLPAEQKVVYLVYLLMSRLGLRNSEVLASRWSWIERQECGAAEFVIERRDDFVPKNKRGRRLDINPELLEELDRYRGLPEAWMVPGALVTERLNACYANINKWLRRMLPANREKGAYELRKHAASIIVSRPESERGGIVGAANFLGDTIATTEKHYATFLRKVRGIHSSEISTARAA